ncbi:MAG: hypothetical protein K2Q25_01190 [Mycobacteriaceae bacterium]|nr:hypothetical protein [Mycobacteriaceae bacterium]
MHRAQLVGGVSAMSGIADSPRIPASGTLGLAAWQCLAAAIRIQGLPVT